MKPIHFSLLLPVFLAGCATPRMATPPDLMGADVLEVSNRSIASGLLVDESFEVGPYQVRNVDRGSHITTGSSFGFNGLTDERSRHGIGFRFTGKESWEGRCDYTSQDRVLRAKDVFYVAESHAQLACRCTSPHQTVQLKLDDNRHPLQGDMMLDAGVHYGVREEGATGSLHARTLGFRIEDADGYAVAAVETFYPGRIWRRPDLPDEQREPQACLLGALMIYELGPVDGPSP